MRYHSFHHEMPEHFAFCGPDLRGRLLDGRYLLESIVGGGGSGTVYAACDRRLKRRVAVKVIHPEHTRLDEQRQRIRQEALVGAQINHPNVAPILDFNVVADDRGEKLYFIVMPLLEGRGLSEVILGGPIPWATACLWTRQLLAGLAALHSRGVLHRDVKSDNCVLVGEGGREVLKLLDLGLAKVTRAGLVSRSLRTTTGRDARLRVDAPSARHSRFDGLRAARLRSSRASGPRQSSTRSRSEVVVERPCGGDRRCLLHERRKTSFR